MKFLSLLIFLNLVNVAFAKDYTITDYGVKSDSTILNTEAIQKVIDLANENGGGTIIIPKGVFLSGALFFKTNTHLKLEEGAVIKGSDNIDNYPLIPSRMEGKNLYYYAALINAYYVDGFTIDGPGKIDGNGLKYWKRFWFYRDSLKSKGQEATNLEVHRPRLVFIWGCNNAVIKNVKLYNSGFWTTHLYQSNNVLIENCDIQSPHTPVPAPSSDAIDIDYCKDITIRGCYMSVNDDAVCIKGGKGPTAHLSSENGIVENVLVEDCTFGFVHATLNMGSECIHAKNIVMRNCKVDNSCPILRMKMRPDTYQIFEDITVENITGNCKSILQIKPWTQFFNMEGTEEQPYAIVRNITMKNIDVNCKEFGIFQGNPRDTLSNLSFENIKATVENTDGEIHFEYVNYENVKINGKKVKNK